MTEQGISCLYTFQFNKDTCNKPWWWQDLDIFHLLSCIKGMEKVPSTMKYEHWLYLTSKNEKIQGSFMTLLDIPPPFFSFWHFLNRPSPCDISNTWGGGGGGGGICLNPSPDRDNFAEYILHKKSYQALIVSAYRLFHSWIHHVRWAAVQQNLWNLHCYNPTWCGGARVSEIPLI